MIGQVVGNYQITGKLGEGGMGAVYKGVDLMLEREVAVKVLRPEFGSQPEVVERFRAEAVTLAKLYHPNIATLHSFLRQADGFYMVMEFVRGETLDKTLRRRGAMGCAAALPLFCQALEGIHYAHRLGVVHRDLKPGNIMLTGAGAIKVMDFGIARVLGTSRLTRTGFAVGTVEYMSPEQILGEETDARSDIYSLGILLYEMLTGRVPFHGTSEFKLMKAHAEEPPPPPRRFAPHVPEEIERAVLRALAKNPAERFASADEFRAALLDAANSVASPAADVKPTRPAVALPPPAARTDETATPPPAVVPRPGASFFGSLNRLHFAGLSLLLLAAVVTPFALNGARDEKQPAESQPAQARPATDEQQVAAPADAPAETTTTADEGSVAESAAPAGGEAGEAVAPPTNADAAPPGKAKRENTVGSRKRRTYPEAKPPRRGDDVGAGSTKPASFWGKHRDKLTVAIGRPNSLIGKKSPSDDPVMKKDQERFRKERGAGPALYTYKLRRSKKPEGN